MPDYISVIYNDRARPRTDYPRQLAAYLVRLFELKAGMRLLEVGPGRGEFLQGFAQCGLSVTGVDRSKEAGSDALDLSILTADLEHEPLPVPDDFFDVVYSKSFIEHLSHPDRYLTEAWRVLKPGGLLLTLVPDWESCFKIFFDDFTHKTPFTCVTLRDLYEVSNFININVHTFRQLPCTWRHPALNFLCSCIAPFVPVRCRTPFLRWSRELMVLGAGRKPFTP